MDKKQKHMGNQNDILLVAQFMHKGSSVKDGKLYYSNGWDEHWTQFSYNTSWTWLMPVVEKIEALGHEIHISKSRCNIFICTDGVINSDHFVSETSNTKIESVFAACVEFIKQYKK